MIKQWYEEYPAVCRDELHTLKHLRNCFTLEQQQPFEQTGNLLVLMGTLKLSQNRQQLVKVVFPSGYPFTPPAIIPLEKQVVQKNGLQFELIGAKRFNSNQYSNPHNPLLDGRMCLFEDEIAWVPFEDNVAKALKQAILWLEVALSPNGFQKEHVVNENSPVILHVGHILYYMPTELPAGNGGRLLAKPFRENQYSILQIQFENAPAPLKVLDVFPDHTVLSPQKNAVIIGRWFGINQPSKALLPILHQPEQFKMFLARQCNISLEDLLVNPTVDAQRTIIAFRFSDSNLFHAFQVHYWNEGITTKFNLGYLLPKDLNKELFSRIDPLLDLEYLQNKKVFIVGVGALGSEIAVELAGSAIGNYVLVDEQPFDAGNTVRHAADLQYLGDAKVVAVKKMIEARNPKAKVETVPANLLDLPPDILDRLLSNSDLVLDFTANPLIESFLHHHCFVKRNLPVIQAAVSRGGLTGNVLIMDPNKSACICCLKEKGLDAVPRPLVDTDSINDTAPDLGTCSRPAVPGNGMDTREISLQAARVGLQFLLQSKDVFYPELKGYQFYWNGPAGALSVVSGEKQDAFKWEIYSLAGHSSCRYCKKDNDHETHHSTIGEAKPADSHQPVS